MTTYKLCFYVPETHAEAVKAAVFRAGVGKIGNYDCCGFQLTGQGQFRPLDGTDPYLGHQGEIETVSEVRFETVVTEEVLKPGLRALRDAHPYEEPAIDLWKLEELPA